MINVVRTFTFPGAEEIEKEIVGDKINIKVLPSPTEKALIENCQDADAIICAYEPLTKRVLQSLPNLKLIAFGTVGFNYVDLAYTEEKNIPVTNISKYCIKEVADYTVGMILMLNRRILQFSNSVKNDKKWQYDLFPDMRRLENLTIGLLGFGNIPRLVTDRLKPFGSKVIAYDPFVDKEEAKKNYDVDLLSLDEVLKRSDVISMHLPVTDDTYQLIDDEIIAKMKEGVILVNSSRGQLVDEEAIVRAINQKKIKYYAADVLTSENPDLENHPFIDKENIIITPHIAFYSQEAIREGIVEWSQNLKNFFDGHYEACNIVNRVNL